MWLFWLAGENPEMSVVDIGKRLGELWREMGAEEKKVYEVRLCQANTT
jgi:hypothetical protein